ncbi:MAG: nicotinamidase, partial [Phototrophicales bacterium]
MTIYPAYYAPERVGQLYAPDVAAATQAGFEAKLPPATEDTFRVYLLLVDQQVDFIHPDGALAVPGAIDDTIRIVNWMYAHTDAISAIGASVDSHIPLQIFFPTWWVNEAGEHPQPYTAISSDDVKRGTW